MPEKARRIPATYRRRAALARCPRCKAPVLAGHDDLGLPTHADPTPLTRTAELALHLAGRPTYAVERGELVARDRWRIRRPATGPVVPEHRCDAPIPADGHAPSPPGRPTADHDQPPY